MLILIVTPAVRQDFCGVPVFHSWRPLMASFASLFHSCLYYLVSFMVFLHQFLLHIVLSLSQGLDELLAQRYEEEACLTAFSFR